jgi:membrane fusion protein, multidrug efflux system
MRLLLSTIVITGLVLGGCHETVSNPPEVRPVRTFTVEGRAEAEIVSLTGQIRAKDQESLAFRLDGRMIERRVNVAKS